jgi:hypothetical protein
MRLLALLLFSTLAQASILHVPQDYTSIQAALDATQNADTVLIARGRHFAILDAPEHTVSLFSNYVFTQDSTDIVETILDGELEGTVLQLHASGEHETIINGLTITRGMNGWDGEFTFNGGIYVHVHANMTLSNSILHHNEAERYCAALLVGDHFDGVNESRVSIYNLLVHSNAYTEFGGGSSVCINTHANIKVERLRFLPHDMDCRTIVKFSSHGDSMIARDIHVNGVDRVEMLFDGVNCIVSDLSLSNFSGRRLTIRGAHTRVDSIYCTNLQSSESEPFTIAADSTLYASNIHIDNCVSSGHTDNLVIHSLLTAGLREHCKPGELRNFTFTNNRLGDPEHDYDVDVDVKAVGLSKVSLFNALFANNTMHIWSDEEVYDYGFNDSEGCLLRAFYESPNDTSRIRNCIFRDNLVIDHDDYSTIPIYDDPIFAHPNRGRSLYVPGAFSGVPCYLEIDHLEFINNRQPNHMPEFGDVNYFVGSDFYLYANHNLEWLSIHDIRMEGVDDGGLHIHSSSQHTDVYNIWMRDVNRSGLRLEAWGDDGDLDYNVENIYIENVVEQDKWHSIDQFNDQFALSISHTTPRNVTIRNCESTYLIGAGGLENSIIDDCQFDFLNLFSPTEFTYMLTDFLIEGVGNQFYTTPSYDQEYGPPYLAEGSPCVDAGNPASACNDLEDPENPGFALWPSQGGLRNDVGYTGGPRASVIDTSWVSLPQGNADELMVKDFHLAAPYPNPFNPSTRVPFTLLQPAVIQLRVYNLLGQELVLLADGPFSSGAHEISWHAGDLASGVYIVQLQSQTKMESKKVLLLR